MFPEGLEDTPFNFCLKFLHESRSKNCFDTSILVDNSCGQSGCEELTPMFQHHPIDARLHRRESRRKS